MFLSLVGGASPHPGPRFGVGISTSLIHDPETVKARFGQHIWIEIALLAAGGFVVFCLVVLLSIAPHPIDNSEDFGGSDQFERQRTSEVSAQTTTTPCIILESGQTDCPTFRRLPRVP